MARDLGSKENAWVVSRGQYCRESLAACDAHTQVLAAFIIDVALIIKSDDSIRVVYDVSPTRNGPTLEDDHFVELFSFGLVHIHDRNAGLRSSIR